MPMGINSAVGHAPFDLFKDEASAENVEAVTLLSISTIVVLLDLGTVKVGDRILISGSYISTKGGTSGITQIGVGRNSGTAALEFYNSFAGAQSTRNQINGTQYFFNLSAIAKVTTAGTLVIRLTGISEGSNGTIAIGYGQLYATFLKR